VGSPYAGEVGPGVPTQDRTPAPCVRDGAADRLTSASGSDPDRPKEPLVHFPTRRSRSRLLVSTMAVLLATDAAGGLLEVAAGRNTLASAWGSEATLCAPARSSRVGTPLAPDCALKAARTRSSNGFAGAIRRSGSTAPARAGRGAGPWGVAGRRTRVSGRRRGGRA